VIATSLTRLLEIELPVIQGGMSWVSHCGLASAVSDAGGLGVLGAATMDPDELAAEIEAMRIMTEQPFGVNVPLICVRPDGSDLTRALIDVVLASAAPIVITGAGSAARYTAELKAAGKTVLHVVPSPELALKAEAAGVDAVVAESNEAGGHVRADGLATLSLVPQVVDAVDCPVVAAGGIADARGVLAALALGAGGAQLGTRFIATAECDAHAAYKRAIVAARAEDSAIYCRTHHASRGLLTQIVKELVERERAGASARELAELRGRHRARLGCIEGELDEGICPVGSGVGLVRDTATVAEVMGEIAADLRRQLIELSHVLDVERSTS